MTPRQARATPITRTLEGGEFIYRRRGNRITNRKELERIEALAIPPAWTNVTIAKHPAAKVLAQGEDEAGRTQTIYHPRYRAKQERTKFARATAFAERLPTLRGRVEADLRRRTLHKERVIACVIKLIDDELFRIGTPVYAQQHDSFGITTLRKSHVHATTSSVTFAFTGKSGKAVKRVVTDPRVVTLVNRLADLRGDALFAYIDGDGDEQPVMRTEVNAYLKRTMGKRFTAKDFRTWGGTVCAMEALLAHELDASITTVHRDAVTAVAKRLGNTPAVAKAAYIDPRLFHAARNHARIRSLQRAHRKLRERKYFTRTEQLTLRTLQRS